VTAKKKTARGHCPPNRHPWEVIEWKAGTSVSVRVGMRTRITGIIETANCPRCGMRIRAGKRQQPEPEE